MTKFADVLIWIWKATAVLSAVIMACGIAAADQPWFGKMIEPYGLLVILAFISPVVLNLLLSPLRKLWPGYVKWEVKLTPRATTHESDDFGFLLLAIPAVVVLFLYYSKGVSAALDIVRLFTSR